MSDPLMSAAIEPLQSLLPAYPYWQFSDDDNIRAFFSAYNELAQGYLDWFNGTPLSVYTNPGISGALLDWVGSGLYGLGRPVISTQISSTSGEMNSAALNQLALNGFAKVTSGTSVIASDDVYKRALTWHLYAGDGRQMSLMWLRRRIARFLYGANGGDFDVGLLSTVSITQLSTPSIGALNSQPLNTRPLNTMTTLSDYARGHLNVALPNTSSAVSLIALLDQGLLAIPFQVRLTLSIS